MSRQLLVLAVLFLLGCQSQVPSPARLVVAASLVPAARALQEKAQALGLLLDIQSGASSLLARQIEQGAPCDVVVLADEEWMTYLRDRNLVHPPSIKNLLGNRLVLIAQKQEEASWQSFLADQKAKLALADPAHVPAGKYAKEALSGHVDFKKLGARVMVASDVRTALFWVEQGEAKYAVVYLSDALSSSKVRVLHIFDVHKPIRYPIAMCKGRGAYAERLHAFLRSPQALDVFARFGFQVL